MRPPSRCVRPVLGAVALLAAACVHRPAPAPHAAEPPAAERTPASVVVMVPGTVRDDWNLVIETMNDSSFRSSSFNSRSGEVSFLSFSERRHVYLTMTATPNDSVRVEIVGREYVGPTDRPGVIVSDPAAWPAIEPGTPAVATLEAAAARLAAAFGPAPERQMGRTLSVAGARGSAVTPSGQTIRLAPDLSEPVPELRDLSDGRKAFCRANNVRNDHLAVVDNVAIDGWCPLSERQAARLGTHNAYVLQDPAATPVGGTLEVCSFGNGIPFGFHVVEWFTDARRCPFDPSWKQKRDPNMMRLRRAE